MSRRRVVEGMLAACALSACGSGTQAAGADAASALRQIRDEVQGQRQCAPLLSGSWPIELSMDALAGAKVDALVAAGLIRRESIVGDGQDRPRVRIVLTAQGKRDTWLRRLDATMPAEPLLCYGRKQVVAVRSASAAQGSEVGGATGDGLRYEYRIVQSPAWTARADILAAFPFLGRELRDSHVAAQAATFDGSKWSLGGDTGPEASADLPPEQGFYAG